MEEGKLSAPIVQLGNWYEENCRHQSLLNEITEKGKIGDLNFQKTEKIAKLAITRKILSPETEYLKFSEQVCFFHDSSNTTLSISFSTRTYPEKYCELPTPISVSQIQIPCNANCFAIIPADKNVEDLFIRFGQDVSIIYNGPLLEGILFLDSQSSFFPLKGHVLNLQGVYLICNQERTSRWKIEHIREDLRFELETLREKIPHNCEILLTHVATGRRLTVCKEKQLKFTFEGFPLEFETTIERSLKGSQQYTDMQRFRIINKCDK